MKKLYNGVGKKIHPSPPPSSPCDLLSVLPVAILALTATLSPEDKEVIVYLMFGAVAGKKSNQQHPPELGCGCFGCYKSFWVRWDASPNCFLIHRILDAVEGSVEPLALSSYGRRCHRFNSHKDNNEEFFAAEEGGRDEGVEEEDYRDIEEEDKEGEEEEEEEEETVAEAMAVAGENSSSSVRGFISRIGEKILGVWNQ